MTELPHDPPPIAPKKAIPPLDTRAPRPGVIRLRRSVVTGAVMGAAALLAGALGWAFIVRPELRTDRALNKPDAEAQGLVRPSDQITARPASYAQLDQLPAPRRLGRERNAPAADPLDRRTSASRPTPSQDPGSPAVQARGSGLFFAPASDQSSRAPTRDAGMSRDYAQAYNTHALLEPLSPYELKAGALIPATLITAIDTARSGPVIAVVSGDVFDTVSGRHLLIPQGARLIGRHDGESRHGDKRAFLVWDRLILPNGKSLLLAKEPGVDAAGAIGARGSVDRRLVPLAVATLFSGAITALGQVARDREDRAGGMLGDAGDAASITAARVGGKLIDRELDVRPSIRLRPGARVRVLITRDLILEPYSS